MYKYESKYLVWIHLAQMEMTPQAKRSIPAFSKISPDLMPSVRMYACPVYF